MKAPTGSQIVAVDEIIPGTVGIDYESCGRIWDYDGNGTQVDWDGQKTRIIAGQDVFIDEDGRYWLESQLIDDNADPLPDDQIKPWHAAPNLRAVEIQDTIEALFKRIGRNVSPGRTAVLVRMIIDIADTAPEITHEN